MQVVVYAIGSPIVVDVEETCRRLGVDIVGWVRNFPAESFAPEGARISEADRVPADLLRHEFTVPLFTPRYRASAVTEARNRGFARPATLVDPTAVIASSATLGSGTYINSLVNIGGACRIGSFCFVNRGAAVGHHTEFADFVSIGPNATLAGMVRVGEGAMIGAGAVVLPRITIGANAVVAAGAVVTKPVAPNATVVGNPAQLLQGRSPGEMNTG